MYLGINIVQRLIFSPFQGKDQVKFRNKIFSKGPLPTHAEAVPPVSREALEISSLCRGVQQ